MLELQIGGQEFWDSVKEEFVIENSITLRLEHSLAAISKWEEKYKKPFLSDKTVDEFVDYIRCMTLNEVSDDVYEKITQQDVDAISKYMEDSHTATWISDSDPKEKKERTITAELVYYWMIEYGIPFECQCWHFQKLMMLIRVCQEEQRNKTNSKPKMTREQIMERNRALNRKRRARLNSKG